MTKRKFFQLFLDNVIWILLVLVVLFFSSLTPRYLTIMNFKNILVHASVLGILVVGQSFPLITGNFDLTMESTLGITAMFGAWLITASEPPAFGSGLELSPFVGIAAMFVLAIIIGWINGFFITRVKINNFIATLSMLIILRGLILVITEGNTISTMPDAFNALGYQEVFGGIPMSVIVMVLCFFFAAIVFGYTGFGRSLYAVGGSPTAALATGIDPDKKVRQAYLISSCMGALAGLVLVGRLKAFPANLGQNMNFEMFAAAVIGGISLQGGRGTMVGAFGGVLLLSAVDSGLNLLRVNSFWIDTIRGLIILLAMFIDAQKLRLKTPRTISKIHTKKLNTMKRDGGRDHE